MKRKIILLLLATLAFQFSNAHSLNTLSNKSLVSSAIIWVSVAGTAVPDTTFNHHYATVNGVKLHYVTCGKGPAVVFLHGWPFTWLEWRKSMVLLAKAGYMSVAPDLRGMGDSEITESGYDKINAAEDIHQLVQLLGLKNIRIVATDIGLMVAYPYAVEHQNEVKQLVLGESLVPGFGLEELMNPATGGYWHFGFHAQAGLASMLIAGKEAAYLRPMYKLMSPGGHIDEATQTEYIRQYSKPGAMKAGFQYYATMIADGKANRANFKGKLTIPVMAINGDRGIPFKQTLDCINLIADHVTPVLLANSGHALGEDNPELFVKTLLDFFNKQQ